MTDPARTDAEKRAGERVSPHILRAKAMAGQRFGRLVAIMDRIERGAGNRLIGSFRCDCGSEVMVQLDSIRGGLTRSCGCLQRLAHLEFAPPPGANARPLGVSPQLDRIAFELKMWKPGAPTPFPLNFPKGPESPEIVTAA